MKVMFTHPTTSKYLEAEVPATMTAEQCVTELLNSTFLDRGDYQLVANQCTMSPGQSLGAAGVVDGSTVVIHRLERGATVAVHCFEQRHSPYPPRMYHINSCAYGH